MMVCWVETLNSPWRITSMVVKRTICSVSSNDGISPRQMWRDMSFRNRSARCCSKVSDASGRTALWPELMFTMSFEVPDKRLRTPRLRFTEAILEYGMVFLSLNSVFRSTTMSVSPKRTKVSFHCR